MFRFQRGAGTFTFGDENYKRKILGLITIAGLNIIWEHRNGVLLDKKEMSPIIAFTKTQDDSLCWVLNRAKKLVIYRRIWSDIYVIYVFVVAALQLLAGVVVDDMEEDDSNGDETDDDTDDFERSLDYIFGIRKDAS
ncbi:hypothetical protein LXL04_028710 [Taraxacum kok-saghyz]